VYGAPFSVSISSNSRSEGSNSELDGTFTSAPAPGPGGASLTYAPANTIASGTQSITNGINYFTAGLCYSFTIIAKDLSGMYKYVNKYK
jgi:hypothetical protein